MTYQQTLDYLFSKLPMYQRIGAAAYKANLDNTVAICNALGNPEKKIKCVHVAGTNGKGSSSHMLAAILQQAGYKTGLYTSPHLVDFRERIRINGKMIPKAEVVKFVEDYKNVFEKIEPSFFEWTVGLALHYFSQHEIDVVIMEVGLGGRLDSTNVITPVCSLITNIGMDHVNLLGDTLPKIATEKAGIIKGRVPVVISQTQLEVISVFNDTAKNLKAPVEFADKNYKVLSTIHKDELFSVELLHKKTNTKHVYELDLQGSYQVKNLMGVLTTIEILTQKGFIIEEKDITVALKNVQKITGLQGRWQIISSKPLVIADTGHNEDGIKEVLENLKRYEFKTLHFVLGVVNDKDITKILKLLPKNAIYYFCKAGIPRALDENELSAQAQKIGLEGKKFKTVQEAVDKAKKQARVNDLVFIGGSTFTVADALLETN
ncbi:MAG: dihydrofolate synthase [Bacteroidetes bacterium]|jgi:dihydrofolate synthase/folylpolyglutamate synthase|nr:dihydrofolate synthase [Bacteroidota bacterium]MDF2451216.1 dihydrofolate synthase [Bacteroidota bacterium]